MLTKAFNCSKCKKPYDCQEGEPRRPGYDNDRCRSWCLTCYPGETPMNHGMMDFLNQPAFKKTGDGYEYTLPINEPLCVGCEKSINVFEGAIVFLLECRHYHCLICYHPKTTDGIRCKKCNITTMGSECYPDARLSQFTHEIVKLHSNELTELREKVKEIDATGAKKEEDRKNKALQNCSDCGIEQPVERLFKCQDCDSTNCGSCSFVSHREHAVVQLLGIELDQMEQRNDKKYTENLEGLHGNLKYIQTTIDEAVEKVLKAGKDRLTEIKVCTKHEDAQKIVTTVDKAADTFEKHCEVYIPVARQLATHLTELGEDLMKNEE